MWLLVASSLLAFIPDSKTRCHCIVMEIKLLLGACRLLARKPDLSRPRLITIPFSHFSEKARWGLDISPLSPAYYEDAHCPAMQPSVTLDMVSAPRVLSWDTESVFQKQLVQRHDMKTGARKEKTAVPKLVLPRSFMDDHPKVRFMSASGGVSRGQGSQAESVVVSGGSSGILKLLADVYPTEMGHLYPDGKLGDSVVELEHYVDTALAPVVTRWLFANTLLTGRGFDASTSDHACNTASRAAFLQNCVQHDVPAVEKVLLRLLGKRFIVPLMCRANGISHDVVTKAESDIHSVFQRMDELLTRNNPSGDVKRGFLLGSDAITAADIAFASLAAPVVLPDQTAALFSSLPALQATAARPHSQGAQRSLRLAQELRVRYRSAQYVLDLYEAQRFRVSPIPLTIAGQGRAAGPRTAELKTLSSSGLE